VRGLQCLTRITRIDRWVGYDRSTQRRWEERIQMFRRVCRIIKTLKNTLTSTTTIEEFLPLITTRSTRITALLISHKKISIIGSLHPAFEEDQQHNSCLLPLTQLIISASICCKNWWVNRKPQLTSRILWEIQVTSLKVTRIVINWYFSHSNEGKMYCLLRRIHSKISYRNESKR
jgi:hypothetical protein